MVEEFEDLGAINGEQINFFDINGGHHEVEIEANLTFYFDQAAVLQRRLGLSADFQTEFVLELTELYNLASIIAGMDIVFVSEAEIEHVNFSRWRAAERMVVQDESRGMEVEPEDRRIVVPPASVQPKILRIMRVPRQNRRIIVPRDRNVLVRQKGGMIPA